MAMRDMRADIEMAEFAAWLFNVHIGRWDKMQKASAGASLLRTAERLSPDRSPEGEKPKALSSREPDEAPKGT